MWWLMKCSASQKERLTLIKVALRNKIGEGGMRHYNLDQELSTQAPISLRRSPTADHSRDDGQGAESREIGQNGGDGVYL